MLLAALAIAVAAGPAGPARAQGLDEALWSKQPLLLFSKSRSDAQRDRQEGILRDRRSEIEARGMVVLSITASDPPLASIGYVSLPPGANRVLMQRFKPDRDRFTAVLVGKDGSELGRWNRPVDPDTLFDLLDKQSEEQPRAGQGDG